MIIIRDSKWSYCVKEFFYCIRYLVDELINDSVLGMKGE